MKTWRKQLKSEQLMRGLDRFKLFEPIITCPPSMPVTKVGTGEGTKLLCNPAQLRPGCTVYSLGSRNDFSFEEAILSTTPCTVHTFDCTSASKTLGARHTYHALCVGTRPDPVPRYAASTSASDYKLLKDIMGQLNHSKIDILKVDIEGLEMQLLEDWQESDQLPEQLSVELHYSGWNGDIDTFDTPTQMAHLFSHLANLGYAAFSKDLNVGSECCSEYTFLRVEKPDYRHSRRQSHRNHS